MSFQTFVTQRLATLTGLINAIVTNAKRIDELPKQENLVESSKFHVSNEGLSQYLTIEDISNHISELLQEYINITVNPNFLALGETATTAYRGDRGKVAYDFALAHNNLDNTSDMNKPVSTAQAAADAEVAYNAHTYADSLITALKDGVGTPGNTLQKLYNLIISGTSEFVVANITERNAYNIPHLPFQIFVIDDGDGKWAKYQATTTGTNATYVKLSDPDLLNAVMSNIAIMTAYESNSDRNAFTNALKAKLDALGLITNKFITGTTYTLQQSDSFYCLVFTSNSSVTVTVPTGLTLNSMFTGKQVGTGQITFVGASGITVNVAPTELNRTAEQFSTWALDDISQSGTTAASFNLYGRLEVV